MLAVTHFNYFPRCPQMSGSLELATLLQIPSHCAKYNCISFFCRQIFKLIATPTGRTWSVLQTYQDSARGLFRYKSHHLDLIMTLWPWPHCDLAVTLTWTWTWLWPHPKCNLRLSWSWTPRDIVIVSCDRDRDLDLTVTDTLCDHNLSVTLTFHDHNLKTQRCPGQCCLRQRSAWLSAAPDNACLSGAQCRFMS